MMARADYYSGARGRSQRQLLHVDQPREVPVPYGQQDYVLGQQSPARSPPRNRVPVRKFTCALICISKQLLTDGVWNPRV